MGDLRVCRICLATDIKLHDLQEPPLASNFEDITGIGICWVQLPQYACYECAALIKKYCIFREKCLKGQSVLYDLLTTQGELSLFNIQAIDREKLGLNTKLTYSTPGQIIEFDHDELKIVKEEKDFHELDEKEVKIEYFDTNNDLATPDIQSCDDDDDDEPLSVHKVIKEKEKKVKKGKRKKVKDEVVSADDDAETENKDDIIDLLTKVVKSRRGRPRKSQVPIPKIDAKPKRVNAYLDDDDADLEEYVTIIKLTEQEQKDEITQRRTSSNYQKAPFQCNFCFKGFIDTNAWKHHLAKHSPGAGDVECPICLFRFKTKRALQKHQTNHEKKYACKSCPYVSKTTTQAKQHQRWHKGVTYKCQYCEEVSTKWTSHLSHVRMKHPSQFICGVCGYSFVSKLGLAMHRTMMHKQEKDTPEDAAETKEEGLYCKECEVHFTSEEAFKRHMVTSVRHIQNKDFDNGCKVCGETFDNKEDLRIHHRTEHARKRPKNYGKKPSNTEWPVKCEHCSEEIANARDYWTHFRRVHPDKKYPIIKSHICEICGKSFRANAFLVYHKRTHSEERTFKCKLCPKAFFNRTNLQMHEKTHSDIRPYPCSVCFKAFKSKGALDRHFRSHTGVKPYECEYCGKSFGQSNSRKLHIRTVHLKQPAPYLSRARLEKRKIHSDKMDAQITHAFVY